jgi:Nrap protein PAP/OAS1-like domain 5/Nrap protein domain 6
VHHQAIRALHTQHSDSFSTAVRLLSLWMSKQCFSGLLSHRQIELLAAAVYLDPTSVCAPTTSSSALFRILDMLGKHDFDLSPIVVSFAPDEVKGAFAHKVASTIQAFKASNRSSGSSLLVLSSTDYGNENEIARISDSTIDTTSLHLIQNKARESALKLVSNVLYETEPGSAADSDIFSSSVLISDCCNIILHFSSAVQCKGGQSHLNGPKYASLKVYSNTEPSSCTAGKLVVSDRSFSSMNSLQEGVVCRLRKQFHDVAIFFWDDTQGDLLGVTLKPTAFLSSVFSSTGARRKISITEGLKAHPPVLTDISQIAMNIYAGGNGCFSDISFQ